MGASGLSLARLRRSRKGGGRGLRETGNSANLSHHMEAQFELDEVQGDGFAVLAIEGADCDHDGAAADVRIEINGKSIFEGQVLIVKRNWSRQNFQISAGLLQKGENKIEIINVADSESIQKWFQRWFMLSGAVIRFAKKNGK